MQPDGLFFSRVPPASLRKVGDKEPALSRQEFDPAESVLPPVRARDDGYGGYCACRDSAVQYEI